MARLRETREEHGKQSPGVGQARGRVLLGRVSTGVGQAIIAGNWMKAWRWAVLLRAALRVMARGEASVARVGAVLGACGPREVVDDSPPTPNRPPGL